MHSNLRKSKFKWLITRNTGLNYFLPAKLILNNTELSKKEKKNAVSMRIVVNAIYYSEVLSEHAKKSGGLEKSEVLYLESLIVGLPLTELYFQNNTLQQGNIREKERKNTYYGSCYSPWIQYQVCYLHYCAEDVQHQNNIIHIL